VRDERGEPIGTVRNVEGTLERSYLVVDGPRGEVMIPMVADMCPAIDIANRRITVSVPEGLIDLNSSRS
jgi:ribosomal 30S subunit maturation factor RimM